MGNKGSCHNYRAWTDFNCSNYITTFFVIGINVIQSGYYQAINNP